MIRQLLLVLVFIQFAFSLFSQEKITLVNPSFEDIPRKGGEFITHIRGWNDCGRVLFPVESPPDIHPVAENAWGVNLPADHGQTYLGLVVRDNDSYETLSQALSNPLLANKCYSFSASIAASKNYLSATRSNPEVPVNFIRPVVLLVWGGNNFCEKSELLGESPPVSNAAWKSYSFTFQPRKTHRFITIEAFYKTPILEAYNGHLLVDNLSDIIPIECPLMPQDLVADVITKQSIPVPAPVAPIKKPVPIKPVPVDKPKPGFVPVLLPELADNKVAVGQKIKLEKLHFPADSVNLLPGSYKVLDELADYMMAFPKTHIEIGGHTNTLPTAEYCIQLSTSRAKTVYDYLVKKGIPAHRLEYKGYGKSVPLYPNDKTVPAYKAKNQRVEIKILSIS